MIKTIEDVDRLVEYGSFSPAIGKEIKSLLVKLEIKKTQLDFHRKASKKLIEANKSFDADAR